MSYYYSYGPSLSDQGISPDDIEYAWRCDCGAELIARAPDLLAENDRLRGKVEAARSILWMAQAYAEGGGSAGPEMREFLAAISIIGED